MRGVRRPVRSIAEGAVSVPAPPERLFGDFLVVQKVTPPAGGYLNPPTTQFLDRGFAPMNPVGAQPPHSRAGLGPAPAKGPGAAGR